MKIQLEDAMNKIKLNQEEIIKLNELRKAVEDKSHSFRFSVEMNKKQTKEKENEINLLKEEIKRIELFKLDQPKLEKKISSLQKIINNLKDEVE